MEREQNVSVIQEAYTDNPEAVEAGSICALTNTDINFSHPNEAPKFMNEAQEESDNEYDK